MYQVIENGVAEAADADTAAEEAAGAFAAGGYRRGKANETGVASVTLGAGGRITVAWDDPGDALEVAHVLWGAGIGPNGRVRDRGFYEDGIAIMDAVYEWEQERARSQEVGSES